MSSRSESPLSDKSLICGDRRFCPNFYAVRCNSEMQMLPFTDSDGLYDFPSSDCPVTKSSPSTVVQQHRKSGRRRDRKASRSNHHHHHHRHHSPGSKSLNSPTSCKHQIILHSPTGKLTALEQLLDIPGATRTRKPSPRRRSRNKHQVPVKVCGP